MTTETDHSMDALRSRLEALPGATSFERRSDGIWMDAPDLDVETMEREMTADGFRMATMTGCAAPDDETVIMYHYAKGGQLVHFKTLSHGGRHPSLAPLSHPASWCERELHDFFAVKFDGHPDLAPLFRPEGMSEGFFRDNTKAGTGED